MGALVALLVPPFLTRTLQPEAYGVWGLVLQLAAYVGYLDFGLQTAVGRFVAHYNETGHLEQRDRLVSTALAALLSLGGLAFAAMAILAWQLPAIFTKMSPSLYGDARVALMLVGGSLALSLPFNVFSGIFVGLQRNEVAASIVVVGKLLGGCLIVVAAKAGWEIPGMALALAGTNVATYLAQMYACRRLAPDIKVSLKGANRSAGSELVDYCFSLSIWSIAMLMVAGLSTTIVGLVDFKRLPYFTVALTLTNFLGGLQNAAFSALMPAAAALGARKDAGRLGEMLISSTRYGMLLLLISGIPLVMGAFPILKLWVGQHYAIEAASILRLLLIANIIRLSATPYAVLLIGTGQQRLVVWTPIAEGCVNLLVSITAGYMFGAMGVAIGALVGGSFAVACNVFYNMKRTKGVSFRIRDYLSGSMMRPAATVAPIVPLLFYMSQGTSSSPWRYLLTASGALLLVSPLIWCFALDEKDRFALKLVAGRIAFAFGGRPARQ